MTAWVRTALSADYRALSAFRIGLAGYLLARFIILGPIEPAAFDNLPAWLQSGAAVTALKLSLYALLVAFLLGYQSRWTAGLLFGVYLLSNAGTFFVLPEFTGTALAVVLLCSVAAPLSRFVSLDDAMDRGHWRDLEQPSLPGAHGSAAVAALRVTSVALFVFVSLRLLRAPAGADQWIAMLAIGVLVGALLPDAWPRVKAALILGSVALLTGTGFLSWTSGTSALDAWLLASLALVFLPGGWFDAISESRRWSARHKLRIYYDQPCGFCRKICYIFASFMLLGRCQIAAAQTHEEAHRLLKEHDSWVVFDKNGNNELCWAAVLLLMRSSPVWAPLGWVLTKVGMGTWGKPLYRLIGHSRGALSSVTARLLPYAAYSLNVSRWVHVALVVAGTYVVFAWAQHAMIVTGSLTG